MVDYWKNNKIGFRIEVAIFQLQTKINKGLRNLLKWINWKEYEVMQIENPLTTEILYYIVIRRNWFFDIVWHCKSQTNQAFFGCDKDGMFGNYQNALKIKMFISGETKIIKRPAVKPKDERR